MRDPLALKVKRPKKKHRIRHDSPASVLDRKLVYITRKISRGDYDPTKISDVIMANVARSHGIVDKENNILKEEYLLCKTKRQKF
jgi:hypothetical protein